MRVYPCQSRGQGWPGTHLSVSLWAFTHCPEHLPQGVVKVPSCLSRSASFSDSGPCRGGSSRETASILHWCSPGSPLRPAVDLCTLLAVSFILTALVAPLSLLVLPTLLGCTFWLLRRNRLVEGETPPIQKPIPFARYLWLLLAPVSATVCYSAAYELGLRASINIFAYLLLTTPRVRAALRQCLPRSAPREEGKLGG